MMQSLTGQYECAHRSGLGLDYFTARLDRLTLYANGRFALITQEKSRLMHAAKNLASGQQTSMDAPETRFEGSYSSHGSTLILSFDSGEEQQAQIQDAGLQFNQNFFEKVSDTTFMPPAQRMKSNMEDIAKGMKIAGAIGGTLFKAAKTLQDTLQTSQGQSSSAQQQPQTQQSWQSQQTQQSSQPSWQNQPAQQQPQQSWQSQPAQPSYTPPAASSYTPPEQDETLFCDQCGAPVRPGKRFCNKCGASLP
jgi:hypothetical protein